MTERLVFIRHAQTTKNVAGKIHRHADPEHLDATGKLQAKALIAVCRRNNVRALYTSPEDRAQETANSIGQGLNLSPKILEDLHERRWGDWEGRNWQDVEQILSGMTLQERYTFVPPHGESWEQMEQRLQRAVEFIVAQGNGVSAIVTHGGALRGLMPMLQNKPKETSFSFNFNNASVSIFDEDNGKYKEVVVNDIAHLP